MDEATTPQIGRYRISGELGRGAMGVVYRATDPSIGRTVAIKTIRMREIHNPQEREKLRERLFREARSAGVLSHPNIVTIYDMDEDEGTAYIAMAFVNGPTLETVLAGEEPLSGARMLRILRQTALALDYAHTKGIVHRDVKPANIMTDEDGSVKITDFGIARIAAHHDSDHNDTKTISGTPNYMSPEQVQGFPVDGKSDQFSLAVIAYEILTGERPFAGEHLSTVVYRIVNEEPAAAHRLNGTLTAQIDAVLRKALSKDPQTRFPHCSAFVGALELACAESRGWKTLAAGTGAEMPTIAVERPPAPPPPAAPPPPEPRPEQEPRVRRAGWIPVLLSVLLVSALGAVFLYESGLASKSSEPAPTPVVQKPEPKTEVQNAPPVLPETPPAAVEAPPPLTNPPMTHPAVEPVAPPREAAPSPRRLRDVFVATTPPGAKVVLDQNEGLSCIAPCQLHAASGTHRLSASLPGYLNESREIQVEDAALDVPNIVLRQPTGTLMLTTNPAGAAIRINGELIRNVTPAELSLKPGTYAVTVEKDGITRTERIQLRESPFYLRIPLNR